jgi:hypothetical protein
MDPLSGASVGSLPRNPISPDRDLAPLRFVLSYRELARLSTYARLCLPAEVTDRVSGLAGLNRGTKAATVLTCGDADEAPLPEGHRYSHHAPVTELCEKS